MQGRKLLTFKDRNVGFKSMLAVDAGTVAMEMLLTTSLLLRNMDSLILARPLGRTAAPLSFTCSLYLSFSLPWQVRAAVGDADSSTVRGMPCFRAGPSI